MTGPLVDDDLVAVVARAWLDGGGDAEGFAWCYRRVVDKIVELEEARVKAES